jgi:N-acetylglutamate synthase-like GNAT family acetyltransferase
LISIGEQQCTVIQYVVVAGKSIRATAELIIYHDTNQALLQALYVGVHWRNNGLGLKLQLERERKAKGMGFQKIYLFVLKDSWMMKWYERRGFNFHEDKDEKNAWMVKLL